MFSNGARYRFCCSNIVDLFNSCAGRLLALRVLVANSWKLGRLECVLKGSFALLVELHNLDFGHPMAYKLRFHRILCLTITDWAGLYYTPSIFLLHVFSPDLFGLHVHYNGLCTGSNTRELNFKLYVIGL